MTEKSNEVKVIKFSTGEEIIAKIYAHSENSMFLRNPYIVQINEEGIALYPWMLTADYSEHIQVSPFNVVSIANAKPRIISGYSKAVAQDALEEMETVIGEDGEEYNVEDLPDDDTIFH